MEKRVLASNIMLVTAAMIWGFSFVFQRAAMEHIGPFTFNACRYLLGALSLIPVIRLNDRKIGKKSYNEEVFVITEAVGGRCRTSHIEPVDAVQSDEYFICQRTEKNHDSRKPDLRL